MKSKTNELSALLSQADKQHGFPPGTMASVVQQETGGKQKYIADPTAYHYDLNEKGQRIAGHTGKVSTAFGPFGLLESTSKDPGYGVKPLQSKDLAEQVRFAGEYLAARSKKAGGLQQGLAGYGEGEKYAKQVLGRIGVSYPPVPQKQVPQSPLAMPDEQIQMAGALPPGPGGLPASFGGEQAPVQFVSLNRSPLDLPPEEEAAAPVVQRKGGPDPWMQLAQYMPRPVTAADFGKIGVGPQASVSNPNWKHRL